MMSGRVRTLDVGGERVVVTNLDKIMYPETGATKGDVLDYYLAIADVLLPYAVGRPVTRKRWVDGVGGEAFFHRDLGHSAPDWLPRRVVHHRDHDVVYPVFDRETGPACLARCAQIAALELHVPQWRFTASGVPGYPDRIVFDLDPGEGVGLAECAEVARLIRAILDDAAFSAIPVTSGSKGIHVYANLDSTRDSRRAVNLVHEIAPSLQADHPDLVVLSGRKVGRRGKVLIDWSQNNAAKTTITPYSLRGRARPTVAMPRTWNEIASGRLRQIEMHEVLPTLRRRGDTAQALARPGR